MKEHFCVDAARGWGRLRCQQDDHLDTLVTSVKLYHVASDRVLPASVLVALQGFDPSNLDFSGMSYSEVCTLAGTPGFLFAPFAAVVLLVLG